MKYRGKILTLCWNTSWPETTLLLIRSCGNEVYDVEKSKEDTWEPWKLRIRNFSITSEEFLMNQK